MHSIAKPYVFPHVICPTPLKVDGYLASFSKRICIVVEFTAPMETLINGETKSNKNNYRERQARTIGYSKQFSLKLELAAGFLRLSFQLSELWDFYLSLRSSVMN